MARWWEWLFGRKTRKPPISVTPKPVLVYVPVPPAVPEEEPVPYTPPPAYTPVSAPPIDPAAVPPPPVFTLASVLPAAVTTAGGEAMTITGTAFTALTGDVGGTGVTINVTNSTTATFTMPAKAAGTYSLNVTQSGTTLTLTNAITVSAAGTNEPAGYIRFFHHNFQALPSGTNGVDGAWYNVVTDTGCGQGAGPNLTIVADATDPTGEGNVIRVKWPSGLCAGWEPCNHGGDDGTGLEYSAMYHRGHYKLEGSDFLNGATGTKFGFFSYGQNPSVVDNQATLMIMGNGSSDAVMTTTHLQYRQQNLTTRNIAPNVDTSNLIAVGAWFKVEVLQGLNTVGLSNGSLKIWVNGTLTHNYTDVLYITSGNTHGFYRWKFHPTFNAIGNRTRDDYARIAESYGSGIAL